MTFNHPGDASQSTPDSMCADCGVLKRDHHTADHAWSIYLADLRNIMGFFEMSDETLHAATIQAAIDDIRTHVVPACHEEAIR